MQHHQPVWNLWQFTSSNYSSANWAMLPHPFPPKKKCLIVLLNFEEKKLTNKKGRVNCTIFISTMLNTGTKNIQIYFYFTLLNFLKLRILECDFWGGGVVTTTRDFTWISQVSLSWSARSSPSSALIISCKFQSNKLICLMNYIIELTF